MLLRSLLVEREPMYRQHETVSTFSPRAFGLDEVLADAVSDDAVGRALDHLFEADRAALRTEVIVAAVQRFEVALEELHNDSTSVRFCGQYAKARGRKLRSKRAPFITYGHSKDHRPDRRTDLPPLQPHATTRSQAQGRNRPYLRARAYRLPTTGAHPIGRPPERLPHRSMKPSEQSGNYREIDFTKCGM